ncbi:hypothetical protein AB0I24_16075 [Brachybacterium paraconglomeratum]
MDFTAINHTDLAIQAARLRATARRIEKGNFTTQSDRVRAQQVGSHLQRASEEIEEARTQLPEAGLDFHSDPT